MRLKACKEAGLKEVPVIFADDLNEDEQKQFIIKDNVGFGEWDWDMIANEWDADQIEEWGLDIPEFSIKEELEAEEDDYEMPDEVQTDIVLGDLFEIGEHRLLCGDSTDSDAVAKLMNGEKADMVFTDPPYGMFLDTDYSNIKGSKNAKIQGGGKKYSKVIGDHNDFTPELINTIFACFDYCNEIFIWGADYFAELIPNKNEGSWIVWDKRGGEDADKIVGSSFELCWSKQKHKRLIARVKWMGAFGSADARERVHPTQKPLKLVEFFLNNWGDDTKLVADLFLGSASTMVAAHQLNRKCYGMELDPKYCQVIVDRMKKLDPSLVIIKNGIAL
jgi:DNA modification methylase